VSVHTTGSTKEVEGMSENAAKQSAGSRSAAAPKESSTAGCGMTHGVPEPHFAPRSPKILARVPDLESADLEVEEGTARAGGDGRMLSTRLSMMVLVGGGGLLLLAALGLPYLLDRPEAPDPKQESEAPSWPVEPPAPAASVAPAWQGAAEQEPSWELPAGTPAQSVSEMPPTSVWSDRPQSTNWDEPSASDPWSSPTPSQQGPAPPAAEAWENEPVRSVEGATRTPAPYGTTGPGRGPAANPEGPLPSPAAAVDPRQSAPFSQHPSQADSNRPMALDNAPPSGTFGVPSDQLQPRRPVYRTAGVRMNSPAAYRADDSPSDAPASYSAATYPVAGQSRGYAPADAVSPQGPISGRVANDPSYPARTAWRHATPPETRDGPSGVARLQGAIERATESESYEHHRSSVY
jgi:hypothetical protein